LLFAENTLRKEGYPAYTTSTAWLGYSDDVLKEVSTKILCRTISIFPIDLNLDIFG